MNNWKDERLNDLYRREQLDRADKAREARTAQEQENQHEFWRLLTRKQSS
jgi:hypothetical protein